VIHWTQSLPRSFLGQIGRQKKTKAVVRKVTGRKVGRMKFSLFFPELDETFDVYTWKYVLDYLSSDLPLKFHGLFTELCQETPKKRKQPVQEKEPVLNDQKCPPESSNDVAKDSDSVPKPKAPARKKIANPYLKPLIRDSVESECEEEPAGENDDADDNDNDENAEKVEEPVYGKDELLYRRA
jgi:hypothetical protein